MSSAPCIFDSEYRQTDARTAAAISASCSCREGGPIRAGSGTSGPVYISLTDDGYEDHQHEGACFTFLSLHRHCCSMIWVDFRL